LTAQPSPWNAFEKRGEILDAFKPAVRHRLEAQFGIIHQGQATDLPLEFFEPPVSQFPVFCFQRATKLLAALFDKGIIPPDDSSR
jgi:hypothetical protein